MPSGHPPPSPLPREGEKDIKTPSSREEKIIRLFQRRTGIRVPTAFIINKLKKS